MSTDSKSRAWVEVDRGALRHNVASIRAAVAPDTRLLPMVKADAYGLGVERTVETLEACDPWGFGVATVKEGRELRSGGVERPVVVLSPCGVHELGAAAAAHLTVTVSHPRILDALLDRADELAPLDFHLEVDTGMGRAGFDWRAASSWGPQAQSVHDAGVEWSGCFTHFHSADEDRGAEPTNLQRRRFQDALDAVSGLDAVRRPGFLRHVSNSAAAFGRAGDGWDLARPGIFLYGGRAGGHAPEPRSVVSLRARVVHLKEARAGDTVGYGATHTAADAELWATVALGYGDGLPRSLGNRGSALARGTRVPIVGRISMDVTVVDMSAVPSVSLGEVVTFLGCDGDEAITVDGMATWAGTISYEILTGFTPRLPRVWV